MINPFTDRLAEELMHFHAKVRFNQDSRIYEMILFAMWNEYFCLNCYCFLVTFVFMDHVIWLLWGAGWFGSPKRSSISKKQCPPYSPLQCTAFSYFVSFLLLALTSMPKLVSCLYLTRKTTTSKNFKMTTCSTLDKTTRGQPFLPFSYMSVYIGEDMYVICVIWLY